MSDQSFGFLLGAGAATAFWVVAALVVLRHLDREWRARLERERASHRSNITHIRPRVRRCP